MKTTTLSRSALLVAIMALFTWGGSVSSMADNKHNNHHQAWSHNKDGYWDNHNHYQRYSYYNNHNGYWRPNSSGVYFFINID